MRRGCPALASEKLGVGELGGLEVSGTSRLPPPPPPGGPPPTTPPLELGGAGGPLGSFLGKGDG